MTLLKHVVHGEISFTHTVHSFWGKTALNSECFCNCEFTSLPLTDQFFFPSNLQVRTSDHIAIMNN